MTNTQQVIRTSQGTAHHRWFLLIFLGAVFGLAQPFDFAISTENEMDAECLEIADVRHVLWYGRIVDDQVGDDGPRHRYHGEVVSGTPTGVIVELGEELVIVTVFLL